MEKVFIRGDIDSILDYCLILLKESVENDGSRIYFHSDGSKFVSHNTDKPIYFVRYMSGITCVYREFLSHDKLLFEFKGPGYVASSNQVSMEVVDFLKRFFSVRGFVLETLEDFYTNEFEKITLFPDSNRVELEDVFDGFDSLPTFYCNGHCLTGPAGTGKSVVRMED